MNVSRVWGLALSLLMTASAAAQPAEHEGEEEQTGFIDLDLPGGGEKRGV